VIASPLNVATPLPFVVAVAFVRLGVPPGVDAKVAVITTPAWLTGFPAPSRNCTTGCAINATPLCAVPNGAAGCVVIVSWLADPAVILIAFDTTGVSTPLVNRSVLFPAVPVIDRFAKVASPLAFVATVVTPPSVPPPDAITAVTFTPN
jgi:hypothetical protein